MQTAYSGQFNGIHSRKTISMLVQERPESIYYCVQEFKNTDFNSETRTFLHEAAKP